MQTYWLSEAWGYWGLSRLDERLKPLVKQRCSIGEYIPVKIATLLAGLPMDSDPDLQLRAWEVIASGRPKMTVGDAQRYIRMIKQDVLGYVKGRPLPDSYILLERLTKRTAKEVEPYVRMIASGTFTQHLSQYSDAERTLLDEEIGELCGLLDRLRVHLKRAEPIKKVS